ncbi:hypothetical protein Halar_2730 [halophilic archaeon DL31]|nr:hypothetical protein Halar_2730 [halophilic archaeon DL31]
MEFAFELALCAALERETDWVLGRQLGAAVERPGSRVMDVVGVVPSDGLEERAAITSSQIPGLAIEAGVGVGEAVPVGDAFDCSPDHAESVVDWAVDAGFLERERRGGRTYVRQTVRYPNWVGELVGIENKPDLGTPGDLEHQLRFDAALGLFDEVWLATESYVTGAHLNRLPDAVGVWRFDPETGERETIREASPLAVDEPGVELLAEAPLQTDVALVSPAEKGQRRRRIAERAWGKGWRTYELPSCARCSATKDGRPYCGFYDDVVDPASDCGTDCPGYAPGDAPDVGAEALRDERTPWVRDPVGVARRQSGLDRFS